MKTPLYIVTDLKDTRWLEYILTEFRRINIFEGDIQTLSLENHKNINSRHKIFYAKDYAVGVSFVNKSEILPQGDITYITNDIYALHGTITSDEKFACSYDIFWNAFVFLSRLEEYLLAQKGQSSLSHLILHPRKDKKS